MTRDILEVRVPLRIAIPVLAVAGALFASIVARDHATVVIVIVWLLYFGLWPVWLGMAIPAAIRAIGGLSIVGRRVIFRSKARFLSSSAMFAILVFPTAWHAINIELGEMRPDEARLSPDGSQEVILSFRSTSRSLDWIDPSCRVHIMLKQKFAGHIQGRATVDFEEISDAERPEVEWLSDKVRIKFDGRIIEIPKA